MLIAEEWRIVIKTSKIITLVLAVVTALIVVLGFKYTSIQIDIISNPPYLLSSNTVKYSVYEDANAVASEQQRYDLLHKLQLIIEENELVFISDNSDNIGLGIYDPSEYYLEYVRNKYPFRKAKTNDILLAETSFYNNNLADVNSIESLGGQKLNVVDYYNKDNPLYSSEKEYIYSYFYEPPIKGDFYISHKSAAVLNEVYINEIVPAYEEADYIIQTDLDYNLTMSELFFAIISNTTYTMAMVILVFVFLNLLLFYINTLFKLSKLMKIHVLFGATRVMIVQTYTKNLLPFISIGSFIGVFSYWLIFKTTTLEADMALMLASFMVNIIVSLILLAVSIIMSFKSIIKKGVLK